MATERRNRRRRGTRATGEPRWVQWLLIALALLLMSAVLLLPLAAVFSQAMAGGIDVFIAAIRDPEALAAIRLTLLVALIAVPLNTLFGIAAAWAVARFDFRGKGLLVTLIDLPFSVSPVIAGMVWVLLFGRGGPLYPWLQEHDLQVVFALPGMVLATMFVTFAFVARELIPLMQAQGSDEEVAALTLGASGWRTFVHVTLPKIRWGLLYGILLCNARAMGEFGAVSVVSGHIRGATMTLPLQVEMLYNDYQITAAFAVASLLALLGFLTLLLKTLLEWHHGDELAAMRGH